MAAPGPDKDLTVVLLHGVMKNAADMWPLQLYLRHHGYRTLNLTYRSGLGSIPRIAEQVHARLAKKGLFKQGRLAFVGHSMGGMVIDRIITAHGVPNLHAVVMIGTPIQGSDYANWLDTTLLTRPLRWLYKELADELQAGSDYTAGIASIAYPAGMIAGTSGMMYPFSQHVLGAQGPHDGMVPVIRTMNDGLTGHITVNASHYGLLFNPTVYRQCRYFLEHVKFEMPPENV